MNRKQSKEENTEEDDLLIKSDAPITDEIKERVKISNKTKKIISDFQKSRFNMRRNTE